MRGRTQILFLTATALLLGGISSAQSLGDVARAERARRAGLEKHAAVLTNEDLQRDQIIVREPEMVPAKAPEVSQQPVPVTPVAPAVSGPVQRVDVLQQAAAPESLGEVARRYRAIREARRRAEAEALAARAPQMPSPVLPRVNTITIVQQQAPVPSPAPVEEKHESAPLVAVIPARQKLEPRRAERVDRKRPSASITVASDSPAAIVVKSGDSLWRISRREFGDAVLWTAIWQANPQVKNPNLIFPGQKLQQPSAEVVARVRSHRHAGVEVAAGKHSMERRVNSIVVKVEQRSGDATSIAQADTSHKATLSSTNECAEAPASPSNTRCTQSTAMAALVRGRR